MKKALLISLISILLLIITGCAGIAKAQDAGGDPLKIDFNFIFKYGVSGGNTLDTFQGTYTKDMIMSPVVTIPMVLTTEEMDAIYQKMVAIDFFNYPDKFSVNVADNETKIEVVPYSTYFFKVDSNGKTKELMWHDKYINSDIPGDKLKELINLIRSIIELKPEYQVLPQASGGYL
ncbi:MAG: hypothetical protein ACYDG5_09095 [Dehalococcoidales bacterium]